MKNLLENTKMLSAIVANIESFERSFKDKGLEGLSFSLGKNEKDEITVNIEGSFDVDKLLVNIREDLILYGEDKFFPKGDKKLSFILEQMKEFRKAFDYMIESLTNSFSTEDEKLVLKITCSLNVNKFKKKGKEVLSSKRKEVTSLDYKEISKEVDKASEEILKKTSSSLKELEEEIKRKHSDEDFFKKFFGDKGDLK
jgi:hypothetical protein